jgi:hypothetical protein
MVKVLVVSLFVMFISFGCAIKTTGKGSWEIYYGVRTEQDGETPSTVSIESSIVDKIVDSLTDGEVSEEE